MRIGIGIGIEHEKRDRGREIHITSFITNAAEVENLLRHPTSIIM